MMASSPGGICGASSRGGFGAPWITCAQVSPRLAPEKGPRAVHSS